MDEFSLIVLEDTLQLATEVLPSELVSECVGGIRESLHAMAADPTDYHAVRNLCLALGQLTEIAHQHSKFLVQTRLQSIARQVNISDVA